jgi:hypothetical protein
MLQGKILISESEVLPGTSSKQTSGIHCRPVSALEIGMGAIGSLLKKLLIVGMDSRNGGV